MIIYRRILRRMFNISGRSCTGNQNVYFCPKTFFLKSFYLWNKAEKILYSQTGHTWRYNTAHAHWMLDNKCYRQALRLCKFYCFSMKIIFTLKCLNVTSYVDCLSCVWNNLCVHYALCMLLVDIYSKTLLATSEFQAPEGNCTWGNPQFCSGLWNAVLSDVLCSVHVNLHVKYFLWKEKLQ